MFVSPEDAAQKIRTLRGKEAPAFVLGMAGNGLSFLRSLGRRGIPVVALEFWDDPGLYSRYGLPVIAPEAENTGELLRCLEDLGEAARLRGVLIPTSDPYVRFVSEHSDALSMHFDFNVTDHETVALLVDKKRQYEYAERHDIEIPLTRYVNDHGIEDIAQDMHYPCVIKPHFSHLWRSYANSLPQRDWRKLAEARTPRDLIDTYAEVRKSGLEFVIQEKIGGGDDHLFTLMTYLDRSSDPLAVFTIRKVRQFPMLAGDSSVEVGVREPEVVELGLKVLRDLKFRGNACVEFKRDPEDGRLKLIEINPRSLLTYQHAVTSGVDIPYITYQYSRGDRPERAMTFREGVKFIDLEKDIKAFRQYRRAYGLRFVHWVKSWRGERCSPFFAWDDPLPAIVGLNRFLRAELSILLRGAT